LAKSDQKRYAEVLAELEQHHAVTPQAAAQLLSWLNQIGRGADAVRWMQTLPANAMQRPPLAVAGAEALRQSGDWPGLLAWTRDKDWGPEADFMRWTYAFQAARMLGDAAMADEQWRTLYNHAQVNSVHALFAAAQLYSWGRTQEGEALWWRAAQQEGQIALDALGSLARHYQVQRDAEGEYRVFRQLHLLKPEDRSIGNNFAFFAALTGREQSQAESAARANLEQEPRNAAFVATMAFTLLQLGRTEEALVILRPRAAEAAGSPALGLAYGLALAATGHRAEARPLLQGLAPESLTLREVELIKSALGD
jgi:Flp pilus assembly protein TadD